eukprot:scaffold13.g209.t1
MGKKRKDLLLKYGCPIYGMCWPPGEFVYMAGGGGLGIENKLFVMSCKGGVQSDELDKLNTGKDAAYRLAMHPSGRHIVCGMSTAGLERVDLVPSSQQQQQQQQAAAAASSSGGGGAAGGSGGRPGVPPALRFAEGRAFKEATADVGAVKGMSFSSDGRWLALGGEDGSVDIREWPHMRRRLRWQASERPIRNVDFSAAHGDGVLFTCDETGACKLWDAATGDEITQLQPPQDLPRATFFRCKSTTDERGIVLFTPLKWKREGWVAKWRQEDDGSIRLEARSRKPATPAPICGFELSRSGELLAAVTPDGDQCVLSSETLTPIKYVPAAHMTFATCVCFSPDETHVLSGSSDASAVLTRVARATGGGGGALTALLVLLALLAAALAMAVGLLLHLAQSQPAELARLLEALPPGLRGLLLDAPTLCRTTPGGCLGSSRTYLFSHASLMASLIPLNMSPLTSSVCSSPVLTISVKCEACQAYLTVPVPDEVRAVQPATLIVKCGNCSKLLQVHLAPRCYEEMERAAMLVLMQAQTQQQQQQQLFAWHQIQLQLQQQQQEQQLQRQQANLYQQQQHQQQQHQQHQQLQRQQIIQLQQAQAQLAQQLHQQQQEHRAVEAGRAGLAGGSMGLLAGACPMQIFMPSSPQQEPHVHPNGVGSPPLPITPPMTVPMSAPTMSPSQQAEAAWQQHGAGVSSALPPAQPPAPPIAPAAVIPELPTAGSGNAAMQHRDLQAQPEPPSAPAAPHGAEATSAAPADCPQHAQATAPTDAVAVQPATGALPHAKQQATSAAALTPQSSDATISLGPPIQQQQPRLEELRSAERSSSLPVSSGKRGRDSEGPAASGSGGAPTLRATRSGRIPPLKAGPPQHGFVRQEFARRRAADPGLSPGQAFEQATQAWQAAPSNKRHRALSRKDTASLAADLGIASSSADGAGERGAAGATSVAPAPAAPAPDAAFAGQAGVGGAGAHTGAPAAAAVGVVELPAALAVAGEQGAELLAIGRCASLKHVKEVSLAQGVAAGMMAFELGDEGGAAGDEGRAGGEEGGAGTGAQPEGTG